MKDALMPVALYNNPRTPEGLQLMDLATPQISNVDRAWKKLVRTVNCHYGTHANFKSGLHAMVPLCFFSGVKSKNLAFIFSVFICFHWYRSRCHLITASTSMAKDHSKLRHSVCWWHKLVCEWVKSFCQKNPLDVLSEFVPGANLFQVYSVFPLLSIFFFIKWLAHPINT